jgi:hypothetical protein
MIPNLFQADHHSPLAQEREGNLALISIAMKCFKRLVRAHINTIIPNTLDPLQSAYHPNRSTDDAISIALPSPTWTKVIPV